MRLTCPKCKANYEIPRHAVPIGGREVKCDSCGHSWFQTRTKTFNEGQLVKPQTEITKEKQIPIKFGLPRSIIVIDEPNETLNSYQDQPLKDTDIAQQIEQKVVEQKR